MIDPNFIDLAARHAGKETPEGLHEICHRLACFNVCYDLERTPFLSRIGHTGAAPNPMEYYQLTAHRETLFSLITPFLNLSYFFTLAETHKKPVADLHTVAIDAASGFPATDTLRKRIDAVADKWRGIMAEIHDHAAAERLFYKLRDHYQLPKGLSEATGDPEDLAEAAGEIVFFTFFYVTHSIMRMPEDYLSGFNTHAGRLAAQAAEAKKQWFEKLLESLDRRKLKAGKTKDYSGFYGVIRGMEADGLKITKVSRGKRRFCAEKIFKELKKAIIYDFEDFEAWVKTESEDPALKNIRDKNFNQLERDAILIEDYIDYIYLNHPLFKKPIRLKLTTFQNHVLSKLNPH